MRVTLCILLVAFICQACGPTTKVARQTPEDIEASARQLILTGNYLAAADEYARLAEIYPQRSVYFQLRTAESLLLSGDSVQARAIVTQVNAQLPEDIVFRKILLADLALAQGEASAALVSLQNTSNINLSPQLSTRLYETRARAYEGIFNYINAAQQRIQLDSLLLDPVKKRENAEQIWSDLNSLTSEALGELRNSSSAELAAWIELALIYQTMLFKPGLFEQSVSSWSEQYPGHLANSVITGKILTQARNTMLQPGHVALLLPLSGQYEKAAHAIRDGFLAAWYREEDDRPQVSIYDANSLNVDKVYRDALANGAEFVVGPLEKNAIESLLKQGNVSVPTLALNHVDEEFNEYLPSRQNLHQGLLQFGLAPEDEAMQVAEKGIFDGHNRDLVITPANDWGVRVGEAFSSTWTSLGGTVLESVSYKQRSGDYATPVKQMLNLDSSQLRALKLRQKLNRALKSELRLREDADMIFMAAVPLSARQIVPQLRFFQASHIPVYASSHSHSGVTDAQADSDMNGIMFVDIPAILSEENKTSTVNLDINRNWSASSSNYRRLYAMGIDAFRIIPHIGRLSLQRNSVYQGETGKLSIDDKGRITRKLIWARIVNGRPRTLDY